MKSVIKGAAYTLVNVPDMIVNNGTTQTTEMIVNPDSEYLKVIGDHIRTYEDVVNYLPNQAYIGNITPDELAEVERPWHDKLLTDGKRYGKFGEIMPEDEFLLLMQICDAFDLIKLEKAFVEATRPKLEEHPLMGEDILARLKDGVEIEDISKLVDKGEAEGLFYEGNLVGYVKRAHAVDQNLSAHVNHENLAAKASGVLSLLHLVDKTGVEKGSIDYVIECSEEACGDMNQRGGGNFAKAVAEIAGLENASGSDNRGFCAAPAHAMVLASSLVQAGTFKSVAVVAGGSTAKLGMNGKDHIKKDLPILEDVVGGFGVLVTEDDGISPQVNLDIVGKHNVGTGSSPQAVISSLVSEPLAKNGMKITDIDKYAPEMQNPDVTVPAGAGNVPEANYKMIGALAVRQGDLERTELNNFIVDHGMAGWAPTQGHIPSAVPYVGFAREDIMSGKIRNAMFVGKGSLFLGRLTNLFDGISFVIEANKGEDAGVTGVSEEEIKNLIANAMKDFAQNLLSE